METYNLKMKTGSGSEKHLAVLRLITSEVKLRFYRQ
jgi:hypothetical protein